MIAIIMVVTYVCILPFVPLYVRRRWLTRQGGFSDCVHRVRDSGPGVGWVLGFARYRGDRLDQYHAFSLAPWPSRSFSRVGISRQWRRIAIILEGVVLFDNLWIVMTKDRFTGHEHNLTMDLENVLGLMAWLESAPPESHYLPGSTDSPL